MKSPPFIVASFIYFFLLLLPSSVTAFYQDPSKSHSMSQICFHHFHNHLVLFHSSQPKHIRDILPTSGRPEPNLRAMDVCVDLKDHSDRRHYALLWNDLAKNRSLAVYNDWLGHLQVGVCTFRTKVESQKALKCLALSNSCFI